MCNRYHGQDEEALASLKQIFHSLVSAGIQARINAIKVVGSRLETETDPDKITALSQLIAELSVPVVMLEEVRKAAEKMLEIVKIREQIIGSINRADGHGHGHDHDHDHHSVHGQHNGSRRNRQRGGHRHG
jgi:histidyl-tRNA synthetase